MSFASDNAVPAHPAILEAMLRANSGAAPSYGDDEWTRGVERALCDLFETECSVLLVATGTAANALSLAALTPPWGAVFCHRVAHIIESEAGAPEFYTGGARLIPLDGVHAKIEARTLEQATGNFSRAWVHGAQPFAVSLTQASEAGACYSPEEIAAIADVAHAASLQVHMDGARFANACAYLGASPAEITWRAGVDILSFGATKNGAIAAEAIVCFDSDAAPLLPHLRKRAGHLLSKHRFVAAQMQAYLTDGLWLNMAAHSNSIAARLAQGFERLGFTPLHPVQANEVFVALPGQIRTALEGAGIDFHTWEADGPDVCRFVASWASTQEEADAALSIVEAAR